MTPSGLRDAHLHLAEHGDNLGAIHLHDCASSAECLERIARGAADRPTGWIVAQGARIEAWTDHRYPSAAELDAAGNGRPVLVASFDHHGASASTAALSSAGIDASTQDPPGGIVERDASGRPTGVVVESAYGRVLGAMPTPTDAEYLERVQRGHDDLVTQGFVEVHDMMSTVRLCAALETLDRTGGLRMAVVMHATPDHFDAVRAWFAARTPSERIRFGGLKLFTDGTLNSRTAWMLHPFADPIAAHPRGTPMYTLAQLDAFFARAHAEGFDVATHAIGDGAVRAVLDAYERVPMPRRCRLRIEHAQFVDARDVPRFARMNVVASMQPCHLLTDIEAIRRLAPHRENRAFPVRDLVESARDAGRSPAELVWFGSDTPVVPPTPNDNIQAAVHRKRAEAGCPRIAPEQAIDEALAWDLMRSTSATLQPGVSAR